jgi:hypothetical protein
MIASEKRDHGLGARIRTGGGEGTAGTHGSSPSRVQSPRLAAFKVAAGGETVLLEVLGGRDSKHFAKHGCEGAGAFVAVLKRDIKHRRAAGKLRQTQQYPRMTAP